MVKASTQFGQVLRALREARSMSQRQLAWRADVSESTIRKNELEPARPIRRSTAIAIMGALHRHTPLSPDEERDYTTSAGLLGHVRAVDAARSAGGEPKRYDDPAPTGMDAEVFMLLGAAIARVGRERVRGVLVSLSQPESAGQQSHAEDLPRRELVYRTPPRRVKVGGVGGAGGVEATEEIEERITVAGVAGAEARPTTARTRQPKRKGA